MIDDFDLNFDVVTSVENETLAQTMARLRVEMAENGIAFSERTTKNIRPPVRLLVETESESE